MHSCSCCYSRLRAQLSAITVLTGVPSETCRVFVKVFEEPWLATSEVSMRANVTLRTPMGAVGLSVVILVVLSFFVALRVFYWTIVLDRHHTVAGSHPTSVFFCCRLVFSSPTMVAALKLAREVHSPLASLFGCVVCCFCRGHVLYLPLCCL